MNRRAFLSSSAAAAAVGVLGRTTFARAWQQQAAQPVFTPIRRNVGYFTMRGGTIGFMISDGGVVVVDTQYPDSAAACLSGLNQRSNNRPVDLLLNTHHHGDHTGGNIAFRGTAKKVVAHAKADEHLRQPPGGNPPTDQLFPDTTFTDTFSADIGDERIVARHYGRAHTSGDAVITFERANVAHMGDLMFNQRHPVVDGPAGATLRGWMTVLDRTIAAHTNDTIYIFGHAGANLPVTGSHSDLTRFKDYISAVLSFVDGHVKAGRSRDEILAMRDPLRGFESYGQFGQSGSREIRTVAYQEITSSSESA